MIAGEGLMAGSIPAYPTTWLEAFLPIQPRQRATSTTTISSSVILSHLLVAVGFDQEPGAFQMLIRGGLKGEPTGIELNVHLICLQHVPAALGHLGNDKPAF